MPQSRTLLYYHFNWATWRRTPLLTDAIERRLYRCIVSQVVNLKGDVLAINGMPDHVHLVVQLPGNVAPSTLMQRAKGVSSTFARQELLSEQLFGWQDGYAAFTVSPSELSKIIAYVQNQKLHHAEGTIIPEWEDSGGEDSE